MTRDSGRGWTAVRQACGGWRNLSPGTGCSYGRVTAVSAVRFHVPSPIGDQQLTKASPQSVTRSVLVAGATGLVGGEVLRQLEADPTVTRIVAIGRRPAPSATPRITTCVVDYDHLEAHADLFAVDQIFCALGTTMKQAGSKAAFRRVDFEYPLKLAQLGLSKGARHFLLVSALGANVDSRIFYNRIKGELEDALRTMGYRSVTIVRPSLLLGKRAEFRLIERIGMVVGEFIPGRMRPVKARDVARALTTAARADIPGLQIIESEHIKEAAAHPQRDHD